MSKTVATIEVGKLVIRKGSTEDEALFLCGSAPGFLCENRIARAVQFAAAFRTYFILPK